MRLQINQLSEADKMFKQFLQDPSVPKKEKLSSLGEILKEMKVSETTSSLFGELSIISSRLLCLKKYNAYTSPCVEYRPHACQPGVNVVRATLSASRPCL